jgi:hypothetical protein
VNLKQLSRWAGFLSLFFLTVAAAIILYALVTLWANELMANLAYYSLIAAFCCFVFWAVSATVIVFRRNRQAK